MGMDTNGLSREEIRKRKRKKERLQAFVALAAILLVIAIVIGAAGFAVVRIFSKDKKETKEPQVDAVAAESVIQETEEPMQQETDVAEEPEEVLQEEIQEEIQEEVQEEVQEETAEDDFDFLEENTEETLALEQAVEDKVNAMTLEQKVATLFFVTPGQLMETTSPVTTVGGEFGEKIKAYPVGGIMLDDSNMAEDADFKVLITSIMTYSSGDIFIGVEHEGGDDSPLVTGGQTENVIASNKEIGESLGTSGAYSAAISSGSLLKEFAINVNFAPNIDVSLKSGSVAEKEGFGADAQTTAELGKYYISGLKDQGIYSAAKYFPSYGDVTHDGSNGQVISQRTKEDLAGEYAPYLEAIEAGASFVMVSHVSLPKVRGDNRPASLSSEVITDIIRTEWGYDGIVITDFMNKSCMFQEYTYAEAAVGAIEAGADMILTPKNFMKSYNGILEAVQNGTLTEERIDESVKRIYRVRLASKVTG